MGPYVLSPALGASGGGGGSGTVTSVTATPPIAITGDPAVTPNVTFVSTDSGRKFIATPSDGTAGIYIGRAIVAADIPSLAGNYIVNSTSQQVGANFNIDGAGVIGTTLTVPTVMAPTTSTLTLTGKAGSAAVGPAVTIQPNGDITSASTGFRILNVTATINQSGTAGYRAINVDITETATGSGVHQLAAFRISGADVFTIASSGIVASTIAVTGASGITAAFSITPTINQSATAGYYGLLIDVTQTALGGGGTQSPLGIKVGAVDIWHVGNAGTITTAGGYNQSGTTANTFTGASTFSAAATGLAVTNNATVGGTLIVTSTLTASNGFTLTTGALSLTATSGAIALSGMSASSMNFGANDVNFTSGHFTTTATGINSTPIGATTASTGAFSTLTSTGVTTLGSSGAVLVTVGNASGTVAVVSSTWGVSSAGAVTGVTAITASGLITGTAGLTITGAAVNLNASSNFAVNVGTGTNNAGVTVGGASNTVAIISTGLNVTTSGAVTGVAALTMSGAFTSTYTSIVSTSAMLLTGSVFTGGSATTTKPFFLIEPSGTASTNWTANGTQIGINAVSGFSGDLIMAQIAAVTKFRVTSGGSVTTTGLITGQFGITITGAAVSLNASSNFAVNIGTGTTNAGVVIGGASNTVQIISTGLNVSTAGALTGVTTIVTSSTINSQTISSAASFTGTLTVATNLLIGNNASFTTVAVTITAGACTPTFAQVQTFALVAATTLAAPTGFPAIGTDVYGRYVFKQDATGGRVVTYNAVFIGAANGVLTGTANMYQEVYWHATASGNIRILGVSPEFAS